MAKDKDPVKSYTVYVKIDMTIDRTIKAPSLDQAIQLGRDLKPEDLGIEGDFIDGTGLRVVGVWENS